MSAIDDMGLYLAYESGYERGYVETVDKACAWLEENLKTEEERHYIHVHGFNIDEFVERFKRAMKNDKH